MQHAAHDALGPWESFYVIVGSSAAALTGLQFVVIALIAETRRARDTGAIAAFGTPTVVHFCAALLAAGALSAPWPTLGGVRAMLLLIGLGGLAYTAVVTARARRQNSYQPVLEDWVWHVVLPLLAYGATVTGAALLAGRPTIALFLVAGASLLLLFIGIHNAWDTVTYVASGQAQAASADTPEPAPSPTPPPA